MHFSISVIAACTLLGAHAQNTGNVAVGAASGAVATHDGQVTGVAAVAVAGDKTPTFGGGVGAKGLEPKTIPMNCTKGYMPFSEADVAALASNDTKVATDGQYSTIPVEAACMGPPGTPDALCDIGSCGNHPICNDCVELTINDAKVPSTGKATASQVICTNNYFFGNATDPVKNLCTDGNDKTWTCRGVCHSFTNCNVCISVEDPALKYL